MPKFLRTHPLSDERVARIKEVCSGVFSTWCSGCGVALFLHGTWQVLPIPITSVSAFHVTGAAQGPRHV